MKNTSIITLALSVALGVLSSDVKAENPTRLLWGDTHLHSSYSFDAFLNLNQSADPDTAYRWAKGLPVIHPYNRTRVQIETPLDFLVVSDHAELMGVIRAVENGTAEIEDFGFFEGIRRRIRTHFLLDAIENDTGREIFTRILPVTAANPGTDPVTDPNNELPVGAFGDTLKTETRAWNEIVDAAERHNDPGTFTSLIGWEWSSIPTGANLHRVVFTPEGGDIARQFLPFGSDQSQYPEDLWDWLEETAQRTGARFLAIPHNSNLSKGYMFAETTLKGEPLTEEYARRRMRWEPVTEVTQIKGDSETHPELSPDDEFAEFETYKFYIQQTAEEYKARPADYIRPALGMGLAFQEKLGTNPYKFGLIGSTDAHTGLASAEEDNFWGKMARDSTPETKRYSLTEERNASGWNMSAQGLAAVWARDNTRDEIYAAFKRREVYATTGPRIQLRVFGGWDFSKSDIELENIADAGYSRGVPMGGDLTRRDSKDSGAPRFLVRAIKDPNGANLDRIQMVKGWIDATGTRKEQVYDLAWSDGRMMDREGHLPVVGTTVDLERATFDNSIGTPELSTVWEDPDFNSDQPAFYYIRVLAIPTPRHSLYDALALGIDPPEEGPASIQERAYSSPIWYTP